VFECTFEKNFLSIFVDVLMQGVSQRTRSLIISSSFVLPWIVTILIAPAVTRFGARNVIYGTFCLKMTLSAIALCVGYRRPLFIGAFAVISRVLTECVCRLNPLVLADLVDEVNVHLPSPRLFYLLPLPSILSSPRRIHTLNVGICLGTQTEERKTWLYFF
jgi:Na+/melibiose symporter-like transporter